MYILACTLDHFEHTMSIAHQNSYVTIPFKMRKGMPIPRKFDIVYALAKFPKPRGIHLALLALDAPEQHKGSDKIFQITYRVLRKYNDPKFEPWGQRKCGPASFKSYYFDDPKPSSDVVSGPRPVSRKQLIAAAALVEFSAGVGRYPETITKYVYHLDGSLNRYVLRFGSTVGDLANEIAKNHGTNLGHVVDPMLFFVFLKDCDDGLQRLKERAILLGQFVRRHTRR